MEPETEELVAHLPYSPSILAPYLCFAAPPSVLSSIAPDSGVAGARPQPLVPTLRIRVPASASEVAMMLASELAQALVLVPP